MPNQEMDQKAVNVIKGLVMDTVRKANSGHPGGPMSSADFAYVLFKDFLNFDPDDPKWVDRDRFILSAGHESALLYSLLTMSGYLDMEDLQNFRQFKSKTPGHPECDVTPGVEATTGPLGQGVAMAGGMAAAELFLGHELGSDIINHYTYALATDGDLQEPVALGSAALFGKWGLGKLIVFFDSNKIQLAGPTELADSTDYKALFESLNWQVLEVDGHNHDQIRAAIKLAQGESNKPSLIIGHTTIAKGSASMENNSDSHGSPFSEQEISESKAKMGLPTDQSFYLPQDVQDHFTTRFESLRDQATSWHGQFKTKIKEQDFKAKWESIFTPVSERSFDWPSFKSGTNLATRKAFGQCLNALMTQLPNLMGGSADLDPSNQTSKFKETVGIFNGNNPGGRNFCFGVREFPMAAILNGLSLHGGIVPFGATFLVFSDYERNAIRMSALQKLPVLHVFTHDSFFVGEDGPTHQPVEHVSSLRLIPNLLVLRPADANESAACMDIALKQTNRPSVLCFTRQGVPVLNKEEYPALAEGPLKGGYILHDAQDGQPEIILLASGSEVHLALGAAKELQDKKIRVVSMPSMELFNEQSADYKEQVLPSGVRSRLAIEAGRMDIWYKYVGLDGMTFGLEHFGDSAPGNTLKEEYGFTVENIINLIKDKF